MTRAAEPPERFIRLAAAVRRQRQQIAQVEAMGEAAFNRRMMGSSNLNRPAASRAGSSLAHHPVSRRAR